LWTLTLSNACTYTGATTIESGTLKLDAGGSIANSASVNLGRVGTAYYGKLDVSAGNKTIKGLSADYADNEVILGATILQIGTSAVTADGGGDFKGKFTGTGGVAKAGLQSLSLSGASTATGTFSHATGTVALAGSWAGNYYQAASTTLDVIGNATIGGTLTLAGGGNINMNLTAMPPAKINVAGSVSASGTTAVNVTATAGNYTLIQAASGLGNAGNFSFNQPGFTLTPTATGTQLNLTVAVTDVTPPTVGVAPAAGTVTAENIPLTWGAATDNQTTAANLRYFVYQSAGNNLSTVANCEANGTLLNAGGTLNLTSYNVTGLTPNTTYYFNVVVSDQAGNKAAYTATSVTTQNAAPPTDMIYQGIQPLPAINAPYNAPKTVAGLGLPQAVTISTDQGNVVGVAITWNVAATNYIMGAESEQTFTVSGTIALPAGVVNPNGLSLTTQVTVTVAARSLNPQVTAVTVTPATANIRKGQGQQFYANVTVVDGADQSVTWTVSGQSVAGTMISSAGYLTVDAGESATSLTVKAQSVFDPNKSGEATVTVDNISNNNNPVIPGLNVYPNPCAEYITIAGAANADLQIIDLSGKIRSMQKIHSDVETIKVGTLARGIYFFRLAKEGKTAVVKIIIN
jgi:autotransporter-associated beta strand protein